MKPGWKTTEFWMALVAQIIAVLVLLKVITTGDAASLEGAIKDAIQAASALAVNVIVTWQYLRSRTDLKVAETLKEGIEGK